MQSSKDSQELLYFWAIGDLHYHTLPAWREAHTQRLAVMFEDLRMLWQSGRPTFCTSPGDLVEFGTLENHTLAKSDLVMQLGDIPFYPGVGNHEFTGDDSSPFEELFSTIWGKPLRYAWTMGSVNCIMLDHPDYHTLEDPKRISVSQENLAFLDASLAEHAGNPTLIFLHCPLRNTVLDRDPEQGRDYHSLSSFFAPENSQEVRDILARHRNTCLFFSGHTHSGWEVPNLVCTEWLGDHPVTFVNLMSPWYTGRHKGLRVSGNEVSYIPDDPDVVTSFAVHVYQQHAVIRVREHKTRQWLKEWIVPISSR